MRLAALATLVVLASLLLVPAVAADPLHEVRDEAGHAIGCLSDAGPVGCILGVEPDPVWCLYNQIRHGYPCR
jgi:hypothetical protein